MPCFTPLKAYRAPGGSISFDSKVGWGDRPLELPCGQCQGCRLRRSREWALRCVHEASGHEQNSFITLTYRPEDLPRDGSLHVEHWQKFAKRLRKSGESFRYFHCGEYGEANLRPHYHACMFGVDFSEDQVLVSKSRGQSLYSSKRLEDAWGLGFVTVGQLTWESAAYVARYVMKKATGALADERYSRVDKDTGEVHRVRPEYITMSRRPGIGSDWYDRFSGDVFPSDEVVHRGRKYRAPRYYDSKLSEFDLAVVKAKRRKAVLDVAEEITPERLSVREEVLERRLSQLHRDL